MDPSLLGELLAVALFLGAIGALLIGYPIAFTLPGVAVVFALIGWIFGVFDLSYFSALPLRYYGILTNEVLIAVPLFVFMGVMLERSLVAEQMLDSMGLLFGKMRGGLGISTVLVATLLAASTGIVGATVATMGLISLPSMLRAGYDKRLATGLICASGTLGQIIPPSTLLVFLSVILQSAYSEAQLAQGNFTPETFSVSDLFAGAFLPGLMLAGLYALWVAVLAVLKPTSAPALLGVGESLIWRSLGLRLITALLPPLILIVAVLGSIIAGVATPTEAAAVGAIGATLITMVKFIVEGFGAANPALTERRLAWLWIAIVTLAVLSGLMFGTAAVLSLAVVLLLAATICVGLLSYARRRFLRVLDEVTQSSLVITTMVFVIFLGASMFSMVFTRMGGEDLVTELLSSMPGGVSGALFTVMAIMFVLGFFLDPFEIIFIVVPIAAPVLFKLGVDPVWLAVLIAINFQTSYLTPPFGFSLFFLRGVAPPSVLTSDIYRGVVPFVLIQLMMLVAVWVFPWIATWLPGILR
ncbi:TRAP transporter large permease subunit [Halothiobacillus sp.]|uniref:TRAP transporter large permease n=1 Tax=Halothiobacillus sp. TaxID=1891311 RepID=UPI002601F61D|nr:TRAP transporter large permease subunit [Halothiobacillus sp.]